VIRSLVKIFGLKAPRSKGSESYSGSEAETINKISRALEALDPARARHIAAFAFILSRVAHADSHVSEEETREMEQRVMQWGNLPKPQAALVVQIARHQNLLFGGTDNFIVTRAFKETATAEEKGGLLHCLFAVSASDDSISAVEEAAITQIASELGIGREEMTEARRAYRDKRAVLKNLPL